eukprot:1080964-Pelagomonas_calceolata.AAC.5
MHPILCILQTAHTHLELHLSLLPLLMLNGHMDAIKCRKCPALYACFPAGEVLVGWQQRGGVPPLLIAVFDESFEHLVTCSLPARHPVF